MQLIIPEAGLLQHFLQMRKLSRRARNQLGTTGGAKSFLRGP